MTSRFNSFNQSPLGGFIESPLKARGGVAGPPVYGNLFCGGSPGDKFFRYTAPTWATPIPTQYPNNTVFDLFVWNGNLYLCGDFTKVGSTDYDRIVGWDGTAYFKPGTGGDGAGGRVHSMCSHGGNLIAVGAFGTMFGVSAPRVARYDGTNWYSMGFPYSDHVSSCLSANGNLYVGGSGGKVYEYSGSWAQVGSTNGNNWVNALAWYNGELWAGGQFSTWGGDINKKYLLKYDTTLGQWVTVGWPGYRFNGSGLLVQGSLLYAGAEPLGAAKAFYEWNGTSWTENPGITNGAIYDLVYWPTNGILIAGSFNNLPDGNVYLWTGSAMTKYPYVGYFIRCAETFD